MVKQHLKRLSSPKTWPILKKAQTFISRPFPGPQKLEHQLPVVVVLRDLIGAVKTAKEARFVLHNKDCTVDGKLVYDEKKPVGLFGVISLPKTGKNYRLLINSKNKLYAKEIPSKEATIKLSKLTGKTTLPGGKLQLNTLDGRSILSTQDYPMNSTLVLAVPKQKINDVITLEKGVSVFLIGGAHVGVVGKVDAIEGENLVVKGPEKVFKTMKKFAVVVGKNKAVISL